MPTRDPGTSYEDDPTARPPRSAEQDPTGDSLLMPLSGVRPEIVHPDELKSRIDTLITETEADDAVSSTDPAEREPGPFAVLFIDLDGMKAANTAYGKKGGDALIRATLQVLGRQLRHRDEPPPGGERRSKTDTLDDELFQIMDRRESARLHPEAGDEFVVLLRGVHSPEMVAAIAKRLETALNGYTTTDQSDMNFAPKGIAASIGFKLYEPGDTAESMYDDAEVDMHINKVGHKWNDFFSLPRWFQVETVRYARALKRLEDENPDINVIPREVASYIEIILPELAVGGLERIIQLRRAWESGDSESNAQTPAT